MLRRIFFACLLSLVIGGCVTTDGVVVHSKNYYDKTVVDLLPEIFRVKDPGRPTVLILHGSGGVSNHYRDWARTINTWNFNAIVIDSFSPRGVRDSRGALARVPGLQRAIDAEEVAHWVKSQDWAGKKVAAIGFSHGGMTVYDIVGSEQLSREIGHVPSIDAAVSLYGPTQSHHFFSTPTIPFQFHVAKLDQGVDYHTVQDLFKSWKMKGEMYLYDDAYHGFDAANSDFYVPAGSDGYVWGVDASSKLSQLSR